MKKIAFVLLLMSSMPTFAALIHGKDSSNNDQVARVNSSGQFTIALLACEDQTNGVCKVEQQMSYNGYKAADTQIKNAAGFVHTISCAGTDATATAGTIILYDNTAESGTVIWRWDVQAVAITQPFSVTLDAVAATGLYLGFTTTADVACTVSYR